MKNYLLSTTSHNLLAYYIRRSEIKAMDDRIIAIQAKAQELLNAKIANNQLG